MLSPYDWQESIAQRAQYIENRLRAGSPIVGLSITDGVLLYTHKKHVRKVYEVYDCLMFSAIGQQADVENLRVTAVDFAHQEGFARSEADVTIGRVVGFALSSPLKKAFGDLTAAPFVVHSLFAEMNEQAPKDLFFKLHYDGDFEVSHSFAIAGGTRDAEARMKAELDKGYKAGLSQKESLKLAEAVWRIGADIDGNGEPEPSLLADTLPEAGFLQRGTEAERKFQLLHF